MENILYQSRYLAAIDLLVEEGLSALASPYLTTHQDYVLGQMQADGGFPGRAGGSDLYYTDFALRVLIACKTDAAKLVETASHLHSYNWPLTGVVECFNYLNCVRLLSRAGIYIDADENQIREVLSGFSTPNATYRKNEDSEESIYASFLGLLIEEMLGMTPVYDSKFCNHIMGFQNKDGGFSESLSSKKSQTNATAAALSVLAIAGCKSSISTASALPYIARNQSEDGGFCATNECARGDLLSAHSAVAVLAFMGNLESINLQNLARFLKSVALQTGGFVSCADDCEADIEYTYYGIALLGILKAFLINHNQQDEGSQGRRG